MYKCRNTTHTCLHVGNVCDGNEDCPFGDELFCYLKDVKCPLKCYCLLLAISCHHLAYTNIELETQTQYLSVSIFNSNIFSLHDLQATLQNAMVVRLPGNSLKEIGKMSPFMKILFLDLEFNNIKQLCRSTMASFFLLQALNINNNLINSIETNSFYILSSLKYLNLSSNPLNIQHTNK